MTTYAVTATSGHLGRLIVESLLARGVDPSSIVAIARTESKAADLAEKGVQVRHGDYDDAASLASAFAGVDRLALVSSSEFGKRAAQHAAAIAAAEEAGVSRIVYTSVLRATETTNPVAPEHVATEQALAASSIPATILRNSWYLENYTSQIGQYLQSGTILGATNDASFSAATRADYADAAAVALTQAAEGVTYELGGVDLNLSDLAAAVTAASGTPVTHTNLTADALATTYASFGMDAGMAGFWAAADSSIAQGDLFTTSGDLEALIGRKATPLADAVKAAL